MGSPDLAVVARVAASLGAAPGGFAVAPLAGGLTNRNYTLTINEARYVVRLAGAGAALLGIDRDRERVIAPLVAAAGIGAEVVYTDAAGEVLATRFLAARPLDVAEASDPLVLARLAALLRRVHGGPAFPGRFDAVGAARELAGHAAARGGRSSSLLLEALAAGEAIAQALGEPQRLAPCHNDMLAANFLVEPDGALRLIDWEYAAQGDPVFDLANLAANLLLAPDAEAALWAAYAGPDAGAAGLARLRLLRVASDLREGCWGGLQQVLADPAMAETDYGAYAQTHLSRVVAAAQGPAFAALLASAGG